ncbi:MAG TPA: M36 family metallopeptidase [Polyangium sp.]|nr:M36 family metallopeptidase [Polyangium sp.]
MKRSARCLTLLATLLGASLAQAKDLPNIDSSRESAGEAASARVFRSNAISQGFFASDGSRRAYPSFVWGLRDPSAPIALKAGTSPAVSARLALTNISARIGLPAAAIDSAVVREIDDAGRGGILVRFAQEIDGVEVFRSRATVMLDNAHRLVAASNNLHPEAVRESRRFSRTFAITPADAVASALGNWHDKMIPQENLVPQGQTDRYSLFDLLPVHDLELASPARVKKVYFPAGNRLVPAYFLEIRPKLIDEKNADAYAYVIAADDARVLWRENLTHSFTYRVWADPQFQNRPLDGPQADYNPNPNGIPNGSSPAFVAPIDVTMDGFNKNPAGTFDPWLPANATVTKGNNVDAYADLVDTDGFTPNTTDIRATTTAPGEFKRTYDTELAPAVNQNQIMAAVTQLFYTTNYLHDYWYDSGFDEAAGNAQASNYGRGGVEKDALRAEAQDFSGTDNANMQAMSDGQSPIMQMFVWTGAATGTASLDALNQSFPVGVAAFGPLNFDSNGPMSLVTDSADPKGDGCTSITTDLTGKIAIVDRGSCTFETKALNAQNRGAAGIVIVDNQPGTSPPAMAEDPALNEPITIPILSVTLDGGNALKQGIQGTSGATAAMHRMASPAVQRDGTIDNLIVSHEWGHYIHLRLVQCGSNMCSAESEGWGDYIALHSTVREGDDLQGTYAVGTYATGALGDSGYFGIRRVPYSTDMNKNALTFKHISVSEALPTTHPVQNFGNPNSESHNAGEVWALMLFESLVALLERSQQPNPPYTFEEARRRMANYVVRGMKMAPSSPTFVEQRDAILAAAAAADPEDLLVIANAFAKRGAGSCAISPETNSSTYEGVVESFDVKANMVAVEAKVDDSVQSCDNDGNLDQLERGRISVDITNTGIRDLTDAVISVSASKPGVTFPNGSEVQLDPVAPFATGKTGFDIQLDGSFSFVDSIELTVTVTSSQTCSPQTKTVIIPYVHYDNLPESSTTETAESDIEAWTKTGNLADDVWSRELLDAPNHVWHGDDSPGQTDTSLESPTIVAGSAPLSITLDHRWDFESGPPPMGSGILNYDGAVIEISVNDGATWKDITAYAQSPYNGLITDISGNTLGNRDGFVRQSPGYPEFTTTTIKLSEDLANESFKMRLRIASDPGAGESGWDIDRIIVEGATNKPFPSIVDNQTSCPGVPTANAGADVIVAIGDTVKLDGTKSKDPDGDSLTFQWTQIDGPSVTLNNATTATPSFVAPTVTATTSLTFRLVVSDGKGSSSDTVGVTVQPDKAPAGGDDGACSCSTVGSSRTNFGAFSLLGLLGLSAARLRRRRR